MRKQTKLVAVLSATSLLAIGASMTSFAATGWVNENGTFYYYDADGEMVTDEWQRDGNGYFYLGEDGAMLTNSWVEDEYYVGPNGAMVTNAWVKTMLDDSDDSDPEDDGESWFYFNNRGRKVYGEERRINNRYYRFDEDGRMIDGWYSDGDDVYYYGDEDDGARKTGWLWLEADIDDGGVDEALSDTDNDLEAWYYFDSTGKRVTSKERKINGSWYAFNDYGQMLYGWVRTGIWESDEIATEGNASASNIENLKYYFNVENGARVTGFVRVDGPNATGRQDDTNWYYFKDGKAKYADMEEDVVYVDKYGVASTNNAEEGVTKYIKKERLEGRYFAFDQYGRMKTGIQPVAVKDSAGNVVDYDVYYFDDNGYMRTGRVSGIEDGDDESTYYFNTNNANAGRGITGEKDSSLYYKGRRQDASDDYKVVEVSGKIYLVNTRGRIQKSSSRLYTDIENEGIDSIMVNSNGEVVRVNASSARADDGVAAADFFAIYGGSIAPKAPYFEP
ncbi:MAG: glucan-binding protein [bacterium]|nr:glucan-binding protein [bacterium]